MKGTDRDTIYAKCGHEIAAYRDFGGVFAEIINLDGEAEISERECRAFAGVPELSRATSR